VITDNVITQAMSGSVSANPAPAGIFIDSIPGGKLPIAGTQIRRNRISAFDGAGIEIGGLVLIATIEENSIVAVTGRGIAIAQMQQLPAEVMIRDNEILWVVPPAPTGRRPSLRARACKPSASKETSGRRLWRSCCRPWQASR
jgi:hypothetical protein